MFNPKAQIHNISFIRYIQHFNQEDCRYMLEPKYYTWQVRESPISESKKGEIIKTPERFGKKDSSERKNSAALRNHCEAEKRRRERINGHFSTLRDFLPCTDKMDKATLLAKVITQVRVLKKQAIEASKGLLVPTDADEVTVEPYNDDDIADDSLAFRVSICCHYRPEVIPDIRQTINDLKLNINKADISTLEGRVKNVLIVTGYKEDIGGDDKIERFSKCIHGALCSVLDKISASEESLATTMFPNKRRKVSCFESSTSTPSL
ncbi:putative transcription factor bHLH107 isoform X2 [Spinacia oleracea]|uniref:Transcription factor bHLH107 isoform X2 n=1 Tax=Spinacia oleracea TaxID=3562 RepID=A0ABM3QLU3_SPIOL|nr:putative transcription factor bHLH107 isoform X2 [Spinacia oleracea]